MDAVTTHTGTAVALRRSDVDTDQIIPAVYLKRVTRTGFEDGLFAAWRADPDFVLNRPEAAGATVLVAGPDFGTGSSREHAVWALMDHGFRVVVSSRFADIFRGNAGKGGLVTAQVGQPDVDRLWAAVEADPATQVTVDLGSRTVSWTTAAGEQSALFDIDDYTRWRLMEGLDDVDLTLRQADAIADYESHRPGWLPTTV
ncbi:MAG TPA: 3-isopropylmalate dehydratase small subunit [Actinomycetes bacterium]|nr:3-isopropylmalate dehydratase small subunit [Actinomycetes bacterium]